MEPHVIDLQRIDVERSRM